MQKIVPYLWFENNDAEEAANYYRGVFENTKITGGMPGPDGKPMIVSFEIEGQEFIGLNGGKHNAFNEAISFYVKCETQAEVDKLYDTLAKDGHESQCGWVQDKFGVSWQIVPNALTELLADEDPAKAGRVMQAMLQMKKIIVKDLQAASDGK